MLAKLIAQVSDTDIQSTVVSLTTLGSIGAELEAKGVKVTALNITPANLLPRFITLAGVLRRQQPDIVQTWMYHANVLGGLAAKLAGVSRIIWNIRHGNPTHRDLKWTTRLIIRTGAWLSRAVPRTIVCCAESARRDHASIGYDAERMTVIHNGFDTEKFWRDERAAALFRQELGAEEATALIGLVGRYHPHKGHAVFIEAAETVASAHSNAAFLLCGFGATSENQELDMLLRRHGVRHRFYLLGERTDMPSIQAALTIACSASLTEGFSNAIGEAMACAVPCVATDVGDSALLLGNTGWIVPAEDPSALASAIGQALSEPTAQRTTRGALARKRIVEMFNINRIAERYSQLYQARGSSQAQNINTSHR